MGDRFPGIDWWCDRCNALLNEQDGFDDHKYTWVCTECGYKNSISRTNIFPSHAAFFEAFLGKGGNTEEEE